MQYNVIVLCLPSILLFLVGTRCLVFAPEQLSDHDWDLLIFTQRWPMTACMEWKEHSKENSCTLPVEPNLWTVHGIWPTKIGTEGPFNCNTSVPFDLKSLYGIEDDLKQYWTNVENNTNLASLWRHEWLKHGTCAMSLETLDTELKYFDQGLDWIKSFNMKTLEDYDIVPQEDGYNVGDIFDAVKSYVGKRAIIECVEDKRTRKSLLTEIRMCFDKSLQIIDCDKVKRYKSNDGVLTNCNLEKPVYYYNQSVLNEMLTKSQHDKMKEYYDKKKLMIKLYKTVEMLIWISL